MSPKLVHRAMFSPVHDVSEGRVSQRSDAWDLLSPESRRLVVERVCDALEREAGAAVRRSETLHVLAWVLGGAVCAPFNPWVLPCVAAGIAIHAGMRRRPRLAYRDAFRGGGIIPGHATRETVLENAQVLRPDEHVQYVSVAVREAVCGDLAATLPASVLLRPQAKKWDLLEWVDRQYGGGAAAMAVKLAGQERYAAMSIGELGNVVRKIGGMRAEQANT